MSYYDNLRGVLQTKLDAVNSMDDFRALARGLKPDTSSSTHGHNLLKTGAWGLALAAVAVAVALKDAASKKSTE